MSEHARRTLTCLVLAGFGGLCWRAFRDPPRPATAPPPCERPAAVAGEATAPGVVCLGPAATAVDALRAAGARCMPATLPPELAPGDRLTLARGQEGGVQGGQVGCRLERDRIPALALRTLRVPVDPNRAAEAELRALPGIGPALARRIVQSRQTDGRFRSAEDLRRVPGIGPSTLERLRGRLEVRP